MKFVLASHNKKKLKELSARFSQFGMEVIALPDDAPEPEETGTTFEENAFIKAKSAMEFTKMPAIADDSGLAVDALNGAPGVYSARYCDGTDKDRNALLLKNMENVPNCDRIAKFVCALACVFPNGEKSDIIVRGECYGTILRESQGDGGFGYDPLFFSSEKNATFSQLTMEEKADISHRGRAIDKLIELLNRQNEEN